MGVWAHPDGALWCGEGSYFYRESAKVVSQGLCRMCSYFACMGRRELRKAFSHLKEWCSKSLWAPSCFHGSVGHGWEVVERYIQNQEKPNAKTLCTGSVLKSGV